MISLRQRINKPAAFSTLALWALLVLGAHDGSIVRVILQGIEGLLVDLAFDGLFDVGLVDEVDVLGGHLALCVTQAAPPEEGSLALDRVEHVVAGFAKNGLSDCGLLHFFFLLNKVRVGFRLLNFVSKKPHVEVEH